MLNVLKYIAIALDVLSALALIAIVLVQSGKSAGLSGAIAGASDSFMAKGGSRTIDAKLAKATKWIGLAFVVLSLLTTILVTASASVQ